MAFLFGKPADADPKSAPPFPAPAPHTHTSSCPYGRSSAFEGACLQSKCGRWSAG